MTADAIETTFATTPPDIPRLLYWLPIGIGIDSPTRQPEVKMGR